MNVISHSSSAWAFATRIASDGGEVRVQRGANRCIKAGETILRAEDEVEQDVVERLRHGVNFPERHREATMKRAFGARIVWVENLGRCPRLVWRRAFGPETGGASFLGRCPRLVWRRAFGPV